MLVNVYQYHYVCCWLQPTLLINVYQQLQPTVQMCIKYCCLPTVCLLMLIMWSQCRGLVNGAYDKGHIAIDPNQWVAGIAIYNYLVC